MKKIIKNPMFTFILGAIIFSGISVLALTLMAKDISYSNSTSGLSATNLQDAVDELYTLPGLLSNQKLCKLKDTTFGAKGQVGSKYECEVGNNIKHNFYILAVKGNTVKLIMEHNITEETANTTLPWSKQGTSSTIDAMTYIESNNLKTTWNNVIDIDLPSAQDIANAVGNTSWKVGDKDYTEWFYLDPNGNTYGQTQVANSTNLSNYRWLYNYTRECTNYGCDSATSLGEGEAYGYWTRDVVAQALDSSGRAWFVGRGGFLHRNPVSHDTSYGVRLVITVLSSNLYEE